MKKILALLIACSIVLAGCMDLSDDDVEKIVDEIVDIPACNADKTAYNYDEDAANNNACLTEMVLKNSVTDFINLMDNGPKPNEMMGMSMEGSGSMEGQEVEWTTVSVSSPTGSYTSVDLNMGMIVWSQTQLITSADDGTTLMQVNYNGAQMLMNSATDFSSLNNMNDGDDDDDGDHSSDDVSWKTFPYCEWEGDSSTDGDTRWYCSEDNQDGSDGFDDWWYLCELDSQDGIWYCSDDFGQSPDWANTTNDTRHSSSVISDDGDMSDDSTDNMDLPSVDIPDSFDPSTALFEAGLATDDGYSFSTTMNDGMGYSITMTFALGMDFAVKSLTMIETMGNETSTSSVTILDDANSMAYLDIDSTLPYHALPFTVSLVNQNYDQVMWTCDNGEEINEDWVNDDEEDCSDGSDENVGNGDMGSDDGNDDDSDMGSDDGNDDDGQNGQDNQSYYPTNQSGIGWPSEEDMFSGMDVSQDWSDLMLTYVSMFDEDEVTNIEFIGNNISWVVPVDSEDECYNGTYDSDNNICTVETGVTVSESDGFMMILSDGYCFDDIEESQTSDDQVDCEGISFAEDVEKVLYSYNHDTNSGIFIMISHKFECGNDGIIEFENYDNGDDDCGDWSDEPNHETGHDDHEEDMVCYDSDIHEILEDYDNQMDCEYAGYMWISSDSGDGHDDHENDDASPQPQDFMNLTDDDGNGTLSLDEWIDYWNEMNNEEYGSDLEQEDIDIFTEAFENHDSDANGEVDLNELEDLLDYYFGDSSDDDEGGQHPWAVELSYISVNQLYADKGTVLSSEGLNCVGCEGNLTNMTPFTSFDITNQSEFENNTGQYGEIYFQFIDQNENGVYDDDEIYAISLEINQDNSMPDRSIVTYNGEWYTNNSGTGSYDYTDFWYDAYGFSWESSDDDHEEGNMACYDTIMEEYDYVRNQTDCEDNGFIWMNLDDDHNENGIADYDEFICDNGNIIHLILVNNQIDDCGDGSDEPHSDDHGDDDHSDNQNNESGVWIGECITFVETSSLVYEETGTVSYNDSWSSDELNHLLVLCGTIIEDPDMYQINGDDIGDGNITLTEATDYLADADYNWMYFIDSAFRCTDYNANSMLLSGEFGSFYNLVSGEEYNMAMLLCLMDLDQSGEVSALELGLWENQPGPISDEDWNEMDTDNSGGLNIDELVEMLSNKDQSDNGDDGDNDMVDDGDNDRDDMYDWIISSSQDMPMEGSFSDYSIILAQCTIEETGDSNDMSMNLGSTQTMDCGEDVMTFSIADAMAVNSVVSFYDADESGTISVGDMVVVNNDTGNWNTVRLHSTSANAYSDENPMMTPGFTGALGMLALLGAALLTRRD